MSRPDWVGLGPVNSVTTVPFVQGYVILKNRPLKQCCDSIRIWIWITKPLCLKRFHVMVLHCACRCWQNLLGLLFTQCLSVFTKPLNSFAGSLTICICSWNAMVDVRSATKFCWRSAKVPHLPLLPTSSQPKPSYVNKSLLLTWRPTL